MRTNLYRAKKFLHVFVSDVPDLVRVTFTAFLLAVVLSSFTSVAYADSPTPTATPSAPQITSTPSSSNTATQSSSSTQTSNTNPINTPAPTTSSVQAITSTPPPSTVTPPTSAVASTQIVAVTTVVNASASSTPTPASTSSATPTVTPSANATTSPSSAASATPTTSATTSSVTTTPNASATTTATPISSATATTTATAKSPTSTPSATPIPTSTDVSSPLTDVKSESQTIIDPKFCPGAATSNDPSCGQTRATITEAITDAATAGVAGRIYIESGTFTESITISNFKVDLMLLGGWDVATNTKVGTSTINGAVNVTNSTGIITFDNLIFTNPITVTSSKVVVKGTTSADTIQVNLVGGNNGVTVDGGDGGDTVTINFGGGGSADVRDTGSGGTDSVVVNNSSNGDTVNVTSNAITRLGGETVSVSGIEMLMVSSSQNILLGGDIILEKHLALVSEQGSILQSGGTLTAEQLFLKAGGSIGSSDSPIVTKVDVLSALADNSGGIYVWNIGSLTVGGSGVRGGNITLQTSGDLTLEGDVTALSGDILLSSGGDITQKYRTDVSVVGQGNVTYQSGRDSPTGAIYIYGSLTAEQGDITLIAPNGITLGGDAVIFTRGSFIVDADSDRDGVGAYVQLPSSAVSVANNTVSITAADVDLGGSLDSGSGDIIFSPSVPGAVMALGGNVLLGAFNLLSDDFANLHSIGTVIINASESAVRVNDLTLSALNLRVQGGMIELGQIALAAGLILQLLSVGVILDGNGAKANLTGGGAAMLGAAAIGVDGDPLEIDVASLVIGSLRSIFNLITGTDPPTRGLASIPSLPLPTYDSSNSTTAYLSFSQSALPLVTVNGSGSNDRIVLSGASGVGQLFVKGGAGDDTLLVDFGEGNPIPVGGLTFDGGDNFDALEFQGGHFNRVKYTAYSPSSGTMDFDGALVSYDNIEPINDLTTATDVTFSGTSGDDIILIVDGGMVTDATDCPSGCQTIEIQSDQFEDIKFANKTNVTVDGGDGNDIIMVSVTTAAAGLSSLTLAGGAGTDVLGVTSLASGIAYISSSLTLAVADFFWVSGTFTIEKSSTTVRVYKDDGNPATDDYVPVIVDVMNVGGDNVSAFVGLNGNSPNALGLTLSGANFGLAKLSDATREWTSLKATATSAALVGISGLTLNATTLTVA
ncbi:MAG: hypothetical protein HZC38_00920 [Chloroflexi bacterium]|nr:hypothetical protein [Chloroflexota bacterium]